MMLSSCSAQASMVILLPGPSKPNSGTSTSRAAAMQQRRIGHGQDARGEPCVRAHHTRDALSGHCLVG